MNVINIHMLKSGVVFFVDFLVSFFVIPYTDKAQPVLILQDFQSVYRDVSSRDGATPKYRLNSLEK